VEERLIAQKRNTAAGIAGIQGQDKHDGHFTADFRRGSRIPFCWLNLRCLAGNQGAIWVSLKPKHE
jgi:hypothetical protein